MKHPTLPPHDKNGRPQTGNPPAGYEYVPGVTVKDASNKDVPTFSVRPKWANGMNQVFVRGIPDSLAKFFISTGIGHVQ
jgi:hypothetical protein